MENEKFLSGINFFGNVISHKHMLQITSALAILHNCSAALDGEFASGRTFVSVLSVPFPWHYPDQIQLQLFAAFPISDAVCT